MMRSGLMSPDGTYHLRKAVAEDAEALTALFETSYSTLMPERYEAAVLEVVLPRITRPNMGLIQQGRFYLVEDADGQCLGCGGWSEGSPIPAVIPNEDGLGHIRHFACHPDFLRQGIAGQLMRKCLIEGERNGMDRWACFSSLNAVSFYASYGFVPVRESAITFGDVAYVSMIMTADRAALGD